MYSLLHSLFGMLALLAIASLCGYALCSRRNNNACYYDCVPWQSVLAGIIMTILLAAAMLLLPFIRDFFALLNDVLQIIETATQHGTAFVFGYLAGGNAPFTVTQPNNSFVLAFRALPIILVISALSSLLYHWRILPLFIKAISHSLQRIMGISGVLAVGTAANIFVGMIEAPLLIRPYLANMKRYELFALMTVGMATVAGTMMALYAAILSVAIPDAMGHILTASIISAPAALTMSLLIIPPENNSAHDLDIEVETITISSEHHSSMDAITSGTLQGMSLLLNIIAMLIVLLALIFLVNSLLALLPTFTVSASPWTLEGILGFLATPLVWLIGIPWEEARMAGILLGEKTILNEFIAYLHLASMDDAILSERSRILMSYALCGFANLGSLGIMIGGLGTIIPERRHEIVQFGMLAIIAGTLSTLFTAAVVSLWLG